MRKAAVGGLLLLLVLAAGTFCTVGRRSSFDCIDCGLYFQDRTLLGIGFPEYDRRIGKAHEHRWSKSMGTAGLNMWNKPTMIWCGRTEALVGADEWLSKVLSHPDEEHRDAALASTEQFDPAWKDNDVH